MLKRPRSPERNVADVKRGVGLLLPALRAIERGEWKPTPADQIMLRALSDILRETRP